jgi:hypothetical protein
VASYGTWQARGARCTNQKAPFIRLLHEERGSAWITGLAFCRGCRIYPLKKNGHDAGSTRLTRCQAPKTCRQARGHDNDLKVTIVGATYTIFRW